eukprot:6491285-Amphidinium_carterae.8
MIDFTPTALNRELVHATHYTSRVGPFTGATHGNKLQATMGHLPVMQAQVRRRLPPIAAAAQGCAAAAAAAAAAATQAPDFCRLSLDDPSVSFRLLVLGDDASAAGWRSSSSLLPQRPEGQTFVAGESLSTWPGFWVNTLTRSTVKELLELKTDTLVMTEHKTVAKYGSLGRHFPECAKQAMRLFMQLPLARNPVLAYRDLFFEPATGRRCYCAAKLLQRFYRVHFKPGPRITPTLLRKLYHSKPQDPDKQQENFYHADGHGPAVARNIYTCESHEDHAAVTYKQFQYARILKGQGETSSSVK